ncbi:MAG TPA: hypothetical protein VEW26_14440, partial [Allosphingosinicella sp.]|nr:hypothetical protein [Allosphingosinicella sp.]
PPATYARQRAASPTRGTMIESGLSPRLGETVLVEFPECSRIHAFVRWARDGRIGLNFGHEMVLG